MIKQIIEWLEKFDSKIKVTIYTRNRELIQVDVFEKEDLIEELKDRDVEVDVLSGNDMHLIIDNNNYMFSVENLNFNAQLQV